MKTALHREWCARWPTSWKRASRTRGPRIIRNARNKQRTRPASSLLSRTDAMRIVKFVLLTIVAMILWAVLVVVGTLESWWHRPLAPTGDTRAFMDAIVEEANANYAGNVALALVHDGKVLGEHFASKGEAVDADTAFQVASLSKWVTAWGVMALVEDGKVDLDAPIEAYLTRWSLPPSEFDHVGVTVRRLLSHTSGLTDGLGYAGFGPGTPVQTLEASLIRTADASPGASVRIGYEPGSAWQYSGGGYTLLQLLIEEVTGESFEAYMQRRILRPLGMSCSTYLWDESSGIKLATFYDVDSSPAIHYRYTASAAASLYTTLRDMTTFVQAHAPGALGEPVGRGVLKPATLEAMRQPQAVKFGQSIWGLGTILYASNNAGGYVIGHDGNNRPAINTAARINPATRNGIVVFETGNRHLATQIANEWVFWETGNVDLLMLMMAARTMLIAIVVGCLFILVGAVAIAFYRRRARTVNSA